MFKKYRHLLFLFLCLILVFSVGTKVYAAETITEERPAETTVESSTVDGTTAEEPTTEEATVAYDNEETIPDEEPEAVRDETLVETTSAEETTATEATAEETTVANEDEETIPANETEVTSEEGTAEESEETIPTEEPEAVAEEALATEVIPEETQVETATATKSEKRLIEEHPEQTEETVPKVGLRGGPRPPGWSKDEAGNWYYYEDYGIPYDGWLLYNGYWYYIESGWMCTGPTWVEDASGGGYYWRLNANGQLEEQAGWVVEYGSWFYFDSDGRGYDGWLSYNGYWYYIYRGRMLTGRTEIYDKETDEYDYWRFDDEGRLITKTEWYQDDDNWFYSIGGKDHLGWLRLNKKWYFIAADDGMYSDKKSVEGILYNFGTDGALIEQGGWVIIGDDWYYLNQDGSYHDGWLSNSGHWYYFKFSEMRTGIATDYDGYYWRLKDSGELEAKAGWVKDKDSGKWYYFDSNGKGYDGWLRYNNKYYYINRGYMRTGPSQDKDGYYWRLKDSGELEERGGWFQDGNYWFYFDSNGKGYDGWLRYNNHWYYFRKGYMCTGPSQDKDGYYWRLKDSGELEERGGWFWLNYEDNPYWLYFDSNGKGYDGWLRYNNKWYYFNKGYMLKDGFNNAGGKLCEFNEEGVWIRNLKGWVKNQSGLYYYANQDGTIPAGWLKYNNKWYYIHEDGQMAFYPTEIGGKLYLFENSGVLANGWFRRDESQYYTNSNGTAYHGWLQQGSKWYYVDNGTVRKHACRIDGKAHKFDRYGVWLSEQ